jgi:hypothetical protein
MGSWHRSRVWRACDGRRRGSVPQVFEARDRPVRDFFAAIGCDDLPCVLGDGCGLCDLFFLLFVWLYLGDGGLDLVLDVRVSNMTLCYGPGTAGAVPAVWADTAARYRNCGGTSGRREPKRLP